MEYNKAIKMGGGSADMKIRVTARFYLVLLLLALLIVYLFRGSIFSSGEIAVISAGAASDGRSVQGVIVRDETVVSEKQVTRVDFVAQENTLVRANQTVAYVYSLEYSKRLINDLNTVRQNIQAYHKIVLGNELDAQLEVHNLTVQERAVQFKSIVNGTSRGNLLGVVDLLSTAMEDRRAYMSANKRSDSKLQKYYEDETQRLNAITSWQIAKNAPYEGLVSFYLDGYEAALNASTVENLEISDVETVLAGGKLEGPAVSRSQSDVFRIMNQNHWYMLLLSTDGKWNPILDQEYSFRVDGYNELVCTGKVIKVTKSGSKVMATLEVNEPIGSLLYTRSGKVNIGTDMRGLSVSKKALATVSGQTGVWLYDVPGGTFIPVEVLTYKKDGTVLFMPLVDGVLTPGTQVLIK